MITYSGVHIQKVGQVEGTPTAIDIAVHAGRMGRFGGAVWEPNLTHFVFVGIMAFRRSGKAVNLIAGFVHDAHECVTGEVPRPFKCECMRREQKALDARIYPRFIPHGLDKVDHDLIKKCDDDACDIEAAVLGLPNYAAIEIEYTEDYRGRKEIHNGDGDKYLFEQLLRGPFYISTVHGEQSFGVRLFAQALIFAEKGDYENLLEYVGCWGFGALLEGTK